MTLTLLSCRTSEHQHKKPACLSRISAAVPASLSALVRLWLKGRLQLETNIRLHRLQKSPPPMPQQDKEQAGKKRG